MSKIDILGGRKFILTIIGLFTVALIGIFKPEALTTELVAAIIGVLGLYNTANTMTAIKSMNNENITNKSVEKPITQDNIEWQSNIEETLKKQNEVISLIGNTVLQKQQAPQKGLTDAEIMNTLNMSAQGVNNANSLQANKNRNILGQFS